MVERRRYVGRGMREDLVVRNFGEEPAYCAVELATAPTSPTCSPSRRPGLTSTATTARAATTDGSLFFAHTARHRRRLCGSSSPSRPSWTATARWEVIIAAQGRVDAVPAVHLRASTTTRSSPAGCAASRSPGPSRPSAWPPWRRSVPIVDTDHEGLRAVVARSAEDLGSLRIFDPDYPERTVVAAGAPWFMTLFGRDSLHHRVDGPDGRP